MHDGYGGEMTDEEYQEAQRISTMMALKYASDAAVASVIGDACGPPSLEDVAIEAINCLAALTDDLKDGKEGIKFLISVVEEDLAYLKQALKEAKGGNS